MLAFPALTPVCPQGTSYYKTYTQFDKGEYPGSNNQQDDFAVISKFLPLIKQEHGTDTATATNMPRIVSSPTATVARSAGVLTDPAVSEVCLQQMTLMTGPWHVHLK
jgi:hypothetical protein